MQYNSVELAYFSPSGSTQRIVECMGRELGAGTVHDLLRQPPQTDRILTPGTLLVVGMPVYGGRIPQVCLPLLRRIKSRNNPALAVVVYGNRAYEDALLELKNALGGSGFIVTGAAAFIGRHSIFPRVAASRPDAHDEQLAAEFARKCREKLEGLERLSRSSVVQTPGKAPYRKYMEGGLQPVTDGSRCTRCGACAELCPTGALSLPEEDGPVVRDSALCIGCAACLSACPHQAHTWGGEQYTAMEHAFSEKYTARCEPEFFL